MKEERPKTSPSTVSSSDINRQMLEIKKKIQLSEGQRKAVFEDCEAERKANSEDIHKLKSEISTLVVQLNDIRKAATTLKIFSRRLERLVGPLDSKTIKEIQENLDLHIIDKDKLLNLIRYKLDKRKNYLGELLKEYQTLLSKKSLKQITKNVDRPIRKSSCELQNSIHAVEVQFREANHIAVRYKDIKKSLEDDSSRFESTIRKIEEELEAQSNDINKLQQVMNEATQMRGVARGRLLQEEKRTMSSAHSREKQTQEGKRLVLSRKQEMEMLEKRIFQSGKSAARVEASDENTAVGDEEAIAEAPPEPSDELSQIFEILKKATGATNTDEVLLRFSSQKDTYSRLIILRQKSENEKRKVEKNLERLRSQLENLKYAEAKKSERKSLKMEEIQAMIDNEKLRSQQSLNLRVNKEKSMALILKSLQELHLCIDPLRIPNEDALETLSKVEGGLKELLKVEFKSEDLRESDVEDKWLPPPYSGLVRRTPLPQPGASPAPPPPASEDEEEVPSRGYLKRQAQLVVDAKSRRKNIRIRN